MLYTKEAPVMFPARVTITLLALLAALLVSGCGVSADYDIASTPILTTEEWVQRPYEPAIYVQPAELPTRPLTAVFIPFRMQQAMNNGPYYAREVSRYVFEIWARERIFPVFEFLENQRFTGQANAIALARAKGADLAVTGSVQQLMAGGSAGRSELSMRLEIYDAYNGQLLWSISDAGSMQPEATKDFVLFLKRSSMPNDPLYAVSASLAYSMSHPVKKWIQKGLEKQLAMERKEGSTLDDAPSQSENGQEPQGQDFQSGDTGRIPVTESLL
ncbi:hypothetical protein [Oceanidesulfovibrio marinus]|nr:hypothetical protein [Oceanidesulfovibrio marinus]